MKFTEVWGETLKQNKFLKLLLILFAMVMVCEGVAAYRLADQTPLLIERGCYTRAVTPKSIEVTPQEMEGFLHEAMSYRFDTDSNPIREFFSEEEFESRRHEQEEFAKKGISQVFLVHPKSIKIDGNKIKFDSERIIMVGNIRSAFPFSFELTVSVIPRSQANPYGIRVETLKEISSMPQPSPAKQGGP
jgi:hypothetical protein